MTPARQGLAPALLFFVAPILILVVAVTLRARGEIATPDTVVERLSRHAPAARRAAAEEGVPLALLLAVAAAESSGRPQVVSPRGAIGLMQLLPDTGEEMAALAREPAPDLADPATSLRLGARYLARQLRRHAGSPRGRELALASYNAGPNNVARWTREVPAPNAYDAFLAWVPFSETRAYVRRVTEWEERWQRVLASEREASSGPGLR